MGTLVKSVIEAEVSRHRAMVQRCYEDGLRTDSTPQAKVTVKFVVDKNGKPNIAPTKAMTLNNPAVERCINEVFLTMSIPSSVGGGIVARRERYQRSMVEMPDLC